MEIVSAEKSCVWQVLSAGKDFHLAARRTCATGNSQTRPDFG
jgi:hypothetical protein